MLVANICTYLIFMSYCCLSQIIPTVYVYPANEIVSGYSVSLSLAGESLPSTICHRKRTVILEESHIIHCNNNSQQSAMHFASLWFNWAINHSRNKNNHFGNLCFCAKFSVLKHTFVLLHCSSEYFMLSIH